MNMYILKICYGIKVNYNFVNLEIAGVRTFSYQGPYHGVTALMSVHDLNISVDQASYTNIYVGSGVGDKVNFLQTGWMVN